MDMAQLEIYEYAQCGGFRDSTPQQYKDTIEIN